jgi:PAS domain S-box-containing protein
MTTSPQASDNGFFHDLLDHAPEGVCVLENRSIVYVNSCYANLLGYDPGELVGLDYLLTVAPEDHGAAARRYLDRGEGGDVPHFTDMLLLHRDGHRVHVNLSSSRFETGGRVYNASLVRKLAHRGGTGPALENAAKQLGRQMLYNPAVFYIRQPRPPFGFTFISDNVKSKFGFSPRELMVSPSSLAQYIHPDDAATATLGLKNIRKNGTRTCEYRVRREDGSYRWVHDEMQLVRDESGKKQEIQGVILDISDHKSLEEQLSVCALEAEASVRAKSDFLASMNHELTTPLNFIIGFSEVLLDEAAGTLSDRQRNYLTRILSGGHRLNALLNDILDLSRIDAGRTVVSPTPIIMDDFLKKCLVLHKEKAFKHSINLGVDLSMVQELSINTDQAILKQIVFNLLDNAVKFTPDGGKVTLTARLDEQSKDCVTITVIDTGIGIDPGDFPKLFKEFTHLESQFTKKYTGTGLGLALVKRLTKLLGGNARAESRPGEGSRFSITIPLYYKST